MHAHAIEAFIKELIDYGFEITAVGPEHYVIDDSGVFAAKGVQAQALIAELRQRYGDCDHLRAEIAQYLMAIGRIAHITRH